MLFLSTLGNTTTIPWFFLLIGLLGGLVLFLYGMEKMSEGLKSLQEMECGISFQHSQITE